MTNNRTISFAELARFGSVDNFNGLARAMVAQQKEIWELVGKNYEALNRIQTKTFDFKRFKILLQFNPERIRSSAAKTDSKSISERPCFLCTENLPTQQKGILFKNKYLILVNPYPIFPVHLTISKLDHTPQLILPYFDDLLDLSKNLSDFTIFYNGPQCGASAPDHFHFQAIGKNQLPIERDFVDLKKNNSELLFQNGKTKIIAVENYLRRFIAIVSSNKKEIREKFGFIYNNLCSEIGEEPMMNVLCSFQDKKWRVIIFPREKQRPTHFFKTGEKQIIVSPATVELAGVMILPDEGNFKKITKKDIREIYGEVTIKKDSFKKLIMITRAQSC